MKNSKKLTQLQKSCSVTFTRKFSVFDPKKNDNIEIEDFYKYRNKVHLQESYSIS